MKFLILVKPMVILQNNLTIIFLIIHEILEIVITCEYSFNCISIEGNIRLKK